MQCMNVVALRDCLLLQRAALLHREELYADEQYDGLFKMVLSGFGSSQERWY